MWLHPGESGKWHAPHVITRNLGYVLYGAAWELIEIGTRQAAQGRGGYKSESEINTVTYVRPTPIFLFKCT